MGRIIEVKTENGIVLIETDEPTGTPGRTQAGAVQKMAEKTRQEFNDAVNLAKSMAGQAYSRLKEMEVAPDEVQIKLGIKFQAEAGAVIAKTSAEGQMEVTVKWSK